MQIISTENRIDDIANRDVNNTSWYRNAYKNNKPIVYKSIQGHKQRK